MEKEKSTLLDLSEMKIDSEIEISPFLKTCPLDFSFALTLPALLADRPWGYGDSFNSSVDGAVLQKLRAMAELVATRGSRMDVGDEDYCEEFSALFEYVCGNSDFVEICKEFYSNQISRGGRELMDTVYTFFHINDDQISPEDIGDEVGKEARIKQMLESNEYNKAEIVSLMEQNENILAEIKEDVRKFEELENQQHQKIRNVARNFSANKAVIE